MKFRIGTRGSPLALAQSRWVAARLGEICGREPELVIVHTTGDQDQRSALADFGGAGAFTREIDEQQRAGRFEVSVHSLKDLPTGEKGGLALGSVPVRAPVEDCLVSGVAGGLDGLPRGATVGTGSARRSAQLLRLRPDLNIVPIRGNVGTRIGKVRDGSVHATLLARAGLERLGLADESAEVLSPQRMLPAAGQGALALMIREGDEESRALVRAIEDPVARATATAERMVLATLGGGCHLPVGVLAEVRDGTLHVRARAVSADGRRTLEDELGGAVEDHVELGRTLGARFVAAGAMELLF